VLLPLALSRTRTTRPRALDAVRRQRTGAGTGVLEGLLQAPGRELPLEQALCFFRRLLHEAYGMGFDKLADLREAGFRILPQGDDLPFVFCGRDGYRKWTTLFVGAAAVACAASRIC